MDIPAEQVLQAVLSGSVILLAGSIKWGAGSLVKRLEKLETLVGKAVEDLVILTTERKHLNSKVDDLEDRIDDLEELVDTLSQTVNKVKLTQERCKACNS